MLVDTGNTFKLSLDAPTPELPGVAFDSRSAALSFMINYDSRDNIFTPSKGLAAEIKASVYHDAWGGDQNFETYSASFTYYTPLNDTLVPGAERSRRRPGGRRALLFPPVYRRISTCAA